MDSQIHRPGRAISRHDAAKLIYLRIARRRRLVVAVLAVTTLLSMLLDVSVGVSHIDVVELFSRILLKGPCVEDLSCIIVWDIRLPVALSALLVGSALGLAGAIMQTILDNPLASPYTLGVSAGAAFGAALVYAVGVAIAEGLGAYTVALNAFVFALSTCMAVYAISRVKGFNPETMILAGIAINYLFHALLAFVEYLASEEALQAIVFWMFGSLYKATWEKVVVVATTIAASFLVVALNAWKLSALKLGDEVAFTLGVNAARLRALMFIIASLLTATTVCFYGIIGFIGLVAPHIARILVGEDQRYLIPCSMLAGSLVLSLASIASKTITPGAVIPIGIVTSFIGAPFFLSLILLRRKSY